MATGKFGIDRDSFAHIMTILRDNLYTDKVLAVMREYAANAWDSHRQSGCGDKPIHVTLPTPLAPTLIIRDFGSGMSEDQVINVYTQFGASTKRDDDISTGMMGIGSKSGFAYSDTFMITSWNGGTKSIYVAVLDETEEGEINKIYEGECGDETGLEIQIGVRPEDITEFQTKALSLFPYFNPLPIINLPLPETNRKIKEHGFFTETEEGWIAVMGCIPYKIDIQQIKRELEEVGIWETLQKTKGGLYFEIGEVQISASREELKYSNYTKKAMLEKFKLLVEAYIEDVLETLRQTDVSNWAKRSRAVYMQSHLKIRVPKKYAEWGEHVVNFFHAATPTTDKKGSKTFFLWKDGSATSHINISEGTKFLIRDDLRPLEGFLLKSGDYVVRAIKRTDGTEATQEEIRSELDEIIVDCRMEGVPIKLLSEVHWAKPYGTKSSRSRQSYETNPKHQVRAFKLLETCQDSAKNSDNWEIAQWEPSDEDIYVIISYFKVEDQDRFFSTYQIDRQVARMLGATMPTVYGYKTTDKKPVTHADCKGTSYQQWRKDFFKKLINTPEILKLQQARQWDSLFSDGYDLQLLRQSIKKLMENMTTQLGVNHPFTKFLGQHLEGRQVLQDSKIQLNTLHPMLVNLGLALKENAAKDAEKKLLAAYPLIGLLGLHRFKDHAEKLIEYIIMVDLLSPQVA